MDWKYEAGRIYSTDDKGEVMAEATFVYLENGNVDIDHTYVNPVLRGQGVAGQLMEAVAQYLKEKGVKATATCFYANDWLTKHADQYGSLFPEGVSEKAPSCKIDGKH